MSLRGKIVIVLASWLFVACSGLRSIPPSQPHLYQSVRDAAEWRNPYLVVYGDGVQVRGFAGRITLEALPSTLAHLPWDAWPYGRVVGVQETGIRSDKDDELVRENLAKVLKSLKHLGIEVQLWPSA
jgi:hypothetical protein